jgi:proteasome accessory factor B
LRPEAGHSIRRRGTLAGSQGDWDLVEVQYRHADALKAEVLGLSGRARVFSPESIADQVRAEAAAALNIAEGPGPGVADGGGLAEADGGVDRG